MKDREERRRLRTVSRGPKLAPIIQFNMLTIHIFRSLSQVEFLSNSLPGHVREPDTEDEEEEDASGASTPVSASGASTPAVKNLSLRAKLAKQKAIVT